MRWLNNLKAVLLDQCGQGLVEYNLILILVSLVAIAALTIIGNYAPGTFSEASGVLQ